MRVVAITAAAVLLAVPAANAAAETCGGEKVTISFRDPGVGTTITGTARADVILGGPQDEKIDGGGGEDVICGGGGGDVIDGGPGRDELLGQDDRDVFLGRDLAQDVITGGVGDFDIADYGLTPAGIRLSMGNGRVRADGARFAGGLLGIEAVLGTPFADHLVGDRRPNHLLGRDGNDVIDGRSGSDDLRGEAGVDTLSYANSDQGIRLSVARRVVLVGPGPVPRDEIGGFEIYIGSRYDDRLVGSEPSERLVGGPGDDTVKGFEDGDTLEGGPGDDVLFPGAGDDLVDGGSNGPVTSIGARGDLVSYQGDTPQKGSNGSFDFELSLVEDRFGDPPMASGVGEDGLVGIESARGPQQSTSRFVGDAGPNVFIGGSRIDIIEAGGGNDLLFGLGGEDSLYGEDGDDYLDGGKPDGASDADHLDGGDGEDVCIGAQPPYRSRCETIG